ncbi:hypothetical protein DRE_01278 [Drechslerella stenobrocha 248]|uniref:BHLH domain-containing protein n=1 Tax=Drechslerella stenobrocha 248 TaxID=1043628 RepID=W7HJ04_9PEZI|nr:hypothetical protein DRE_01278 [Drechslerella stenobrocha 248]
MASGRAGYEYMSPHYNMQTDSNNTTAISIGINGDKDYPDVDFGQCFLDQSSYTPFGDDLALFPCTTHQSEVPGLSATVTTPSEMAGFDFSSFLTGASPPCAPALEQAGLQPPCGASASRQSSSMGSSGSGPVLKRSPMTPSLDYEIEEVPPVLWALPPDSATKSRSSIAISHNSPDAGGSTSSTSSVPMKIRDSGGTGVPTSSASNQHPKHITSTRKLSKQEAQQVKKAAHSTVEKRYRANLNTKITHLHEELVKASEEDSISLASDMRGSKTKGVVVGPPKTRKADVLTDALNFVNRSQKEKKMMKDEIDFLKMRIMTLEKLVKCEDCLLLKQMDQMRMPSAQRLVNY